MGTDFQNVFFVFLALVLGVGAEELLPKLCGVGIPILLALAVVLAPRLNIIAAGLVAAASGAAEDAISGLAPFTSISFFLLASGIAQRTGVTRPLALLAYPCFQLWLSVWTPGLNVFSRFLVALPAGYLMMTMLSFGLAWAAGDEREGS